MKQVTILHLTKPWHKFSDYQRGNSPTLGKWTLMGLPQRQFSSTIKVHWPINVANLMALDEMRIYNRALSEQEVLYDIEKPLCP